MKWHVQAARFGVVYMCIGSGGWQQLENVGKKASGYGRETGSFVSPLPWQAKRG